MTNANQPHRSQSPTAGSRLLAFLLRRTIVSDVVQDIIIGAVLAFITAQILAPQGMKQISSPNNSVLVLGRILVYRDADLPTAYDLAKKIQLTPLSQQ